MAKREVIAADLGDMIRRCDVAAQINPRTMASTRMVIDGRTYILAVMTADMHAIIQQITQPADDPRFNSSEEPS